jgi:hypothetical protein
VVLMWLLMFGYVIGFPLWSVWVVQRHRHHWFVTSCPAHD